jgi:sec-independent protein translocase protein TatA
MGSIGPGELLIIALIALLLFGAGRIADIGKGLGQGIKNFKEGLKDADGEPKPADAKVAGALNPAPDKKEKEA